MGWLALAATVGAGSLIVVTPPENTNAILHNPDMGWVVYENYPIDPQTNGSSMMLSMPDETYPEADVVGLMFTWQDIEKREGCYDFSRVDTAYDHWRQRGKMLQLRLSSESLLFWGSRSPPAGGGVPDYVLSRLAPREKQTRHLEGCSYVVPDARNAFYRKRLAAFLRAVEKHFGPQRPVNLIDLRGFGAWGEWHTGFIYPSLPARRDALKGIIDIWSSALPRHLLDLAGSYDPDSPAELHAGPTMGFHPEFTANYRAFLRFSAFDHALAKPNIAFRRDGCGGAVHANERKLNDEAFRVFHRAPMSSEFIASYENMAKGGSNWVSRVVDDGLSLHPNYLNLIGWQDASAANFARQRPDLIARGLRQMGYRLVPTLIQYPETITVKKSFGIRFDWINRGVGRALRDYEIQFLLADATGKTIAESAPEPLPTSEWLAGQTYHTRHHITFHNCPSDKYKLTFRLRDPLTGRLIALPIFNNEFGPVTVSNLRQ